MPDHTSAKKAGAAEDREELAFMHWGILPAFRVESVLRNFGENQPVESVSRMGQTR